MKLPQRFVCLLLLSPLCMNGHAATAWGELRRDFIEAIFADDPVFAVGQGRHEFDGQIPDLSPAALARKVAMLRSFVDRAQSVPTKGLSARDSFERDLLIWYCGRRIFWVETARWPYLNPEYYGGTFSPSVYITRDYAPLEARLAGFTRWLGALPTGLEQMRQNLSGPLPRVYIDRAIGRFGGLAAYLEVEVPRLFDGVGTADAQRAFREANLRAVAKLREIESWFRTRSKDGHDGFAMGTALFAAMLERSERIDQSLPEIAAANERDLARNHDALVAVCGQFAPDASIEDCVARVESIKSERGVVAAAADQLAVLEAFVRGNDLVSVPLPDRAEVAEAPPYQRANSAYIERPGPLEERDLPSIYYISPPDPSWTAAEQLAYRQGDTSLLFTSIHEVWPGHFLQGLHAKAYASPLAQLLRATTFSEGWAHYSEELMWEAGFGAGRHDVHIAQLKNALWRNVRFRSAVGLHTQGMTLAESERQFREVAYLDAGNARQQAARGAYDPDYLAYTLGKLQIRALRDEWTASRGGAKAWKSFHDTLLSYGAPPISIVRKYMVQP